MFTMDASFRDQPRLMPGRVVERVARAIGAHVAKHELTDISILLHGGEPLLAGADRLSAIATTVQTHVPSTTRVRFGLQTNGVLLDAAAVRTLAAAGIQVAVSLDGDAEAHNRHRRKTNGSGSYILAREAIRLLAEGRHRRSFAGLLCVVDLANDPTTVYRALAATNPPVVDFLLPFGNWSTPPPGRLPDDSTPYGDWLCAAFDAWYDAPEGRPEVRLFREVITLLLGGTSRTEQIGLSPARMVVFNLDGKIEQVDSLRSAYPGAASTALSGFTHDLEDALAHPAIAVRQFGLHGLAEECRACPLVKVCGGGHYVHRFARENGFQNRSVFCKDLSRLILHVRRRVGRSIPANVGSIR